jgi:CubicO group peptidase (beta-lactamase class C family)
LIARAASVLLFVLVGAAARSDAQGSRFPSDSIDRLVRSEMERQHIPGMSVAVLVGDSVMMARGYGYANLELHVPASDSTVYQSGSVGKQFTAALVLMLSEQGRLKLDDPIIRYFPEGRSRWAGITIRHLLNHTSGIPDYTDNAVDLHREYTEDQLVRVAATLPLSFQPGSHWNYSNTGYLLLGALIHRATGTFYGDLLRDSLFRPLGMPSARIISEADIVPNRAAGYRLVHGAIANQEWVSPSVNTTADGSLYLSLRDYVRWTVALNHGERPSRRVLEMAWTPASITGLGTYPYGAGWFLFPQRGHRKIGHTGAWQGFQTSIQRYPEYDLTVIALSNLGGSRPGPLSETIAGIVVPALAAPHTLAPGSIPPSGAAKAPVVLQGLARGTTDTSVTTPEFRRFITPWKQELREETEPVASWTVLGCDSLASGVLAYLDRPIARACYVRGTGPEASVLATLYYSADDRIGGIEIYDY